ncbi:hypothetical protein HOF92_01200, partial [bacterium]|nr:hypothetical protein [bacterium]
GAGTGNDATSNQAAVVAGQQNNATGNYSIIGAGTNNGASGEGAAVLAGWHNEANGKHSAVVGGRKLKLTGERSLGFRGSSNTSQITRSQDDTVFFIQTALCVGASNSDCAASMTAGEAYADAFNTSNADYAEYFEQEGLLHTGDLVGLNLDTGKVRKYHEGDALLGIVSKNPGIVGNAEADRSTHALVAVMGQVEVNREQVQIQRGMVYSHDGIPIGLLLASGRIYINLNSADQSKTLQHRLRIQEQRILDLEQKLKFLMKN